MDALNNDEMATVVRQALEAHGRDLSEGRAVLPGRCSICGSAGRIETDEDGMGEGRRFRFDCMGGHKGTFHVQPAPHELGKVRLGDLRYLRRRFAVTE